MSTNPDQTGAVPEALRTTIIEALQEYERLVLREIEDNRRRGRSILMNEIELANTRAARAHFGAMAANADDRGIILGSHLRLPNGRS